MNYIHNVDFAVLQGTDGRSSQRMIGPDYGIESCDIRCIKTPPGGGSPAGLHAHAGDQFFYILSGTMKFEIDGVEYESGPGALIVFPAGVPHRNWNPGPESTVHLAIDILA